MHTLPSLKKASLPIVWLTLGWLAIPAQAAVTVIRQYHLGEADTGVVIGGVATNSIDSSAGKNLAMTGSPVYSTDTPAGTNSSESISFNGTSYGTANLVGGLTDNFGIEAWVKTTTIVSSHYVVYNGDPGTSGWGFLQNITNYIALFGGAAIFGSAPAPTNQWTDVAVVRNNGVAVFYVNGVPAGSTTATPNAPAGSLAIGANPGSPGTETWNGQLDEVRVFTFAPGAFQINDLFFYSALPILNLSQQADTLALTWPTNVVTPFKLQYTTNLASTNWTRLFVSTTNNGRFTANDPITPGSRYYRLNEAGSPCGTNALPYLPPGSQILMNGNPITNANIVIPAFLPDKEVGAVTSGNQVLNHGLILPISAVATANIFDASAFIDPSACPDEPLRCLWTVTQGPNAPGLSGTNTPILTLDTNTLVPGTYSLNLAVLGSGGLVTNQAFTLTFTNTAANPCGLHPSGMEGGGGLAPFVPDGDYFDNGGLLLQDPGTASWVGSFDDGGGFFELDFSVNGNDGFVLGATTVIDPATCNNSSLTYHWELQDNNEQDIQPIGVTGFDTPTLTAGPLSIRDGRYTLYLTATGVNSQSTFRFVIDFSGVGNGIP